MKYRRKVLGSKREKWNGIVIAPRNLHLCTPCNAGTYFSRHKETIIKIGVDIKSSQVKTGSEKGDQDHLWPK